VFIATGHARVIDSGSICRAKYKQIASINK